MITWDIGRRCNFDCTYCESTRHDTVSPPTPKHNLEHTLKFIQDYTLLYNQPNAILAYCGEPTVNPEFLGPCRKNKQGNRLSSWYDNQRYIP